MSRSSEWGGNLFSICTFSICALLGCPHHNLIMYIIIEMALKLQRFHCILVHFVFHLWPVIFHFWRIPLYMFSLVKVFCFFTCEWFHCVFEGSTVHFLHWWRVHGTCTCTCTVGPAYCHTLHARKFMMIFHKMGYNVWENGFGFPFFMMIFYFKKGVILSGTHCIMFSLSKGSAV